MGLRGLDCRFIMAIFLACMLALFIAGSHASSQAVFFEPFDESYESRWVVSESPAYEGKWKWSKGETTGDYGLLVTEKAKKYGIAAELPQAVDPKKGALVLQYDVRLQNGLDCGGAYLKFLMPQEAGWTPSQFKDDSPYSIMFGPDKCGATNKVHFIFRHKSPVTEEYIEHHLKTPPHPQTFDKLSHCYTAIVYPNNTLQILIDGDVKTTADLLGADFAPSVLPPKTIPDKDDKKPEDWDERAKIPDPDATKPDDWDENAPREIVDEEATKPEGWLDDEPELVDDPEAKMPEDWDVEEDGEWEPPKVPNPKCEEAPGCGDWKRPMKRNPAYKGKWSSPMIDNPAYQGIWKPRNVPNPEYFDLERPNLEPVAAVGIEIWTMSDGILFDNILVTDDVTIAESYRKTKWQTKADVEREAEKEKREKEEEDLKKKTASKSGLQDKVFKLIRQVSELPALKPIEPQLSDLIDQGEKNPPLAYAVIGAIVLAPFLILFLFCLGGGSRSSVESTTIEQAKKEDISSPDDAPVAESSSSAADNDAAATSAGEETAAEETEGVSADDVGEETEGKVRRRTRRD